MQFKNFNRFVAEVIREGNRLQKHDITGKQLTRSRFTDTQVISIIIAIASLFILPKGFSSDFAGYTISFLGIFIGLFSSIVISMYDKRSNLFDNYKNQIATEKARIIIIKNYLIQFTGLTSYAIFLALILIGFLSLILLLDSFQSNIFQYRLVHSLNEINGKTLLNFLKASVLVIHRFFTTYLFCNFLMITLFSMTSYFSFLLSEYKSINTKND
jgi:hypothetical protein